MNQQKSSHASLTTFIAILLIFLVLVLAMVAQYLIAIVIGGILALLAAPLYRRIVRKGVKPRLAATLITLGVILLVLGPFLTFAALAIKQGVALVEALSTREGLTIAGLIEWVTHWIPFLAEFEPKELAEQIEGGLQSMGKSASVLILAVTKSIPGGILQLFLACLTCFFMLVDGPHFLNWISLRIPLASDVRQRLTGTFRNTAISVIWASMAAAGTQAIIMFLTFLALGVPAAFLAGGVTFVFAFIPILGSTPVWVVGGIFLFTQGAIAKMVAMIALGMFTGVVDNFVRPWILKGRSEMHPLVSLVSIFGGIQMFGLFGVFLGPILAAVVITLLQVWPMIGKRYGLEFDNNVDDPA